MDDIYDMPKKNNDALFTDLLPDDVLSKCSDFSAVTEANLLEIIHDNADTEVGTNLNFSEIDTPEKFRAGVALSKYPDYSDFIECMRMGDDNLITGYRLYSYLKTSGNDGSEKIIPLTEKALSHYRDYVDVPCERIRERSGGKRLMISMLRADIYSPPAQTPDMLFSGAYYSYRYKTGRIDIGTYAGREAVNYFHRNCDYLYAKVWLAFACSDITTFESIYLYDVLLFFRYMENHFQEILEHMKAGEIPLSVNLPQRVKKGLLSLETDETRLNTVKRECEKGFGYIVNRLWSHLKVVSGIGSDIYRHEEDALRQYIGDVTTWYFCYVASECLIGMPLKPGSKEYLMLPDSAYYEFLPEEHSDEPEKDIKTVNELVTGENYEIVLTTYSGLYRYMLGDVVKVIGFYGTAPIIRFLYRRNQVLNIAGEKINEKTLTNAVDYTLDFYRHEANEYFFRTDYTATPACYEAFFSSDKKLDELDVSYFARVLDTTLRQKSYYYNDLRNLNMVGAIRVNWLTPEEYGEIINGLENRTNYDV